MLLIATDEAGYGPKLGPLVIAATVWRLPGNDWMAAKQLQRCFAPFRQSVVCGPGRLVIGDSKTVYQPGRGDGLQLLHAAFSAALHWCGRSESTLQQLLSRIAPGDWSQCAATSWLNQLGEPSNLSPSETAPAISRWSRGGVHMIDMGVRVITARRFNQAYEQGQNKADLLSESTLQLIGDLLDRCRGDEPRVDIFCDRHGGRRYYAPVVQHALAATAVTVDRETHDESIYRIESPDGDGRIRFTVNGDSFAPVAFSSMHAKYLRERFMQSLNRFFQDRHREPTPLRPTAGYSRDANRFLADIQPIVRREQIDHDALVRCR